MFSLRTGLLLLGALNIIAVLVLVSNTNQNQVQLASIENENDYKFIDPDVSYDILELLDVPKKPNAPENPKEIFLGIKRDGEYCRKVRDRFVHNPEELFDGVLYLCDYKSYSLTRTTLPSIGTDKMPDITYELPKQKRENPTFDLDVSINTIYTNRALHGKHFLFGKELVCLSQSYNHIPGIDFLNRKDKVAESVNLYARKYKSRPQCFDQTKFFPRTWLLDEKVDCEEWFDIVNSPAYEAAKKNRTIVYIRKLGAGGHQGKGVEPVNEVEENDIRQKYGNGTKCGKVKTTYIVQDYIHNPLLVMGHKFDFRVYMLIASTNPVIAYYHDGFLRVSLIEYNVTKNEKGMHLTNTHQSKKFLEKAIEEGANETELMNFQMWNYTRLAKYLVSVGKIESEAWIDDYLRPAFQHAMAHLIRMTQRGYYAHSSVWEMFGADFMLDEDLNLWFIECNSGPAIQGSNEEKTTFLKKMLTELFEVVHNLLKSRMKRVVKYVNFLVKNRLIEVNSEDPENVSVQLKKPEHRRKEFEDVIKNRFEEELEVSADNGWVKIVDENYEGLERYRGMIRTECFDT